MDIPDTQIVEQMRPDLAFETCQPGVFDKTSPEEKMMTSTNAVTKRRLSFVLGGPRLCQVD
jgi:hypothetical protein